MSDYIQVDDVRNSVLDRTAEDNELYMALVFTTEDIEDAMRRAAREYNSVPPLINTVYWNQLPAHTNIFLDATVLHLYLSRLAKLQRNDIEYTSGGVEVALEKKQIAHLKDSIPMYRDRFLDAAKAEKLSLNIRRGFGRVG